MKVTRNIHDGEFILSALIIVCAYGKLSWAWFWIALVLSSLQVLGWNRLEYK